VIRVPHLTRRQRQAVALGTSLLLVAAGFVAYRAGPSGDESTRLIVSADDSTSSSTDSASTTSSSAPVATSSTDPTTSTLFDRSGSDTSPPTSAREIVSLPEPGDFSGELYFSGEECEVCRNVDKNLRMVIRNDSEHTIDLLAPTERLAAVCGPDLNADGSFRYPPTKFPFPFVNELLDGQGEFTIVDGQLLRPGGRATTGTYYISSTQHYPPTAPHDATYTCEGAIVATTDGSWRPQTLTVVARLDNVPTRSITIIVEQTTTTSAQGTTTTNAEPSTT